MQESALVQVALPALLAFIMFGMGSGLTPADFARIGRYPKAALLGLFGQLAVLPALGMLVAALLVDDPIIAAGVILVAACPGGTMSNLVCWLADGNTALSISMTAVSSLVTLFSIPLVVKLGLLLVTGADAAPVLPVGRTLLTLLVLIVIPVTLGMVTRHFKASMAKAVERLTGPLGGLLMIALVVGIVASERDNLPAALAKAGIGTLVLNCCAVGCGLGLGRLFGLNRRDRLTLGVEVGIQNSTLAMLLAMTVMDDPMIAIPAGVYSLVMYLTALPLIGMGRFSAEPRPVIA